MKKGKISLSRKLKKLYHKQRISAFILMMGLGNFAFNGFRGHWTLLSWTVFTITISLFIHWLKLQKNQRKKSVYLYKTPRRYLPSDTNYLTPLPPLKRKRDYH